MYKAYKSSFHPRKSKAKQTENSVCLLRSTREVKSQDKNCPQTEEIGRITTWLENPKILNIQCTLLNNTRVKEEN
jgi:hypothetical protein